VLRRPLRLGRPLLHPQQRRHRARCRGHPPRESRNTQLPLGRGRSREILPPHPDSFFTQLHLHTNRSAGISLDWKFNRNLITDATLTRNGSQGIFMRDSNENTFRNLYLRDNGEQGLFVAETREIPGSACQQNRFERLTITGNKTQGIRINDPSCTENVIVDSRSAGNAQENVSLSLPGMLIGAENVRQQ
jgi:parallel beta-helix repeat protein